MNTRKTMEDILKEFGKAIGIDELALDAEDACILSFDDIVVSLQYVPDNHSVVLISNLGECNSPSREELLAEMLEGDFYERARGGPTVGLHRDSNTVWTIQQLHAGVLDIAGFEAAVEHFVNFSDAWRKRIPDGGATTGPKDDTSAPIPPGMRA